MSSENLLDDLKATKLNILNTKNLDSSAQLRVILENFNKIYQYVSLSSVDIQFRVIACDTLSIFLKRCIQLLGKNPELRSQLQLIYEEEKADFLFHYVLDFWNDSGAALGNALKEMFVKFVTFLTIILDKREYQGIIENWLSVTLDLPLTRKAFYFMIENLYRNVESNTFIIDKRPQFIEECLENIWSRAIGSSVGKCVFLILRHAYDDDHRNEWLKLWSSHVIKSLKHPDLRKGIESYLLPNLFQVSKPATVQFLQQVIDLGDIPILLSLLKVAQDSSILIEPFLEIDPNTNKPLVEVTELAHLLTVQDSSLRIAALQLLTLSPKLSKAIPTCVYHNVINSFDMIFMETDLEIRNELFSYLKRFISRIKDSSYALHRDATSLTKKNYAKFKDEVEGKLSSIEESKAFIINLLEHIEQNIMPGSPYARKEMAFRLLTTLIKSGVDSSVGKDFVEKSKGVCFPYSLSIYTDSLVRLVIDNIMDSFEDVRKCSIQIISMCPRELKDLVDLDLLEERAVEMLSDIKGKDVDSGARFFMFLFNYYLSKQQYDKCQLIIQKLLLKIDDAVIEAKKDISRACIFYSIQGYYAAFKFIFENADFHHWSNICDLKVVCDKLIESQIEIWEIVKLVLQHDSPEGIVLDKFELNYTAEYEQKFGKGSQIILSYAWRSIKESSNMLEILLSHNHCPLSDEQILVLGSVLLEQLATIRHPGAFSSVYPTFVSCCVLCSSRKSIQHIPETWLAENLKLVQTRSNYITRRSAGIPYLITAILSSNKSLIKPTFFELLEVADSYVEEKNAVLENVNLPQVNAFNCIKAIFVDAKLSEESILYVDQAFALTLHSFASPYWAIRNCAVMLFTALQNRLFSSKKVKANYMPTYPARLFFEKFTTIRTLFLETLKDSLSKGLMNQAEIEKVFPVLTIMGRLEPTPGYNGLDAFVPILIEILGNKIWKVREMASRSLPSLISNGEKFDKIINLLIDTIQNDEENYNKMQGSLLAVREIILKFRSLTSNDSIYYANKLLDPLNETRAKILTKNEIILVNTHCYPIKLAYLQILNLLNFTESTTTVDHLAKWFSTENFTAKTLNGSRHLTIKEAANLLLQTQHSDDIRFIESLLGSTLYEVQLSCINHFNKNCNSLSNERKQILTEKLWILVENDTTWSYVKSQALQLLQHLIVESSTMEKIDELVRHTEQLIKLCNTELNEDIKLSAVEALGSYVSKLMIIDQLKYKTLYDTWIGYVKNMIADDLEFRIRNTALKSFTAFHKVYSNIGSNDKIKLNIEAYLFHFLSDDDESIQRATSHHLVKYVFKQNNVELVPVIVEKKMLSYFAELQDLEMLELLISHEAIKFYDVKSSISDLVQVDSLLFGAEKENMERNCVLRIRELIFLIHNSKLKYHKTAFENIATRLQENILEVTNYIVNNNIVDGCFGILSNETIFDFVACQILLFKSLKKFQLIDFDIENFKEVLQSPKIQLHPYIVSML